MATGFGLGYLPIAPGTWGSLGGVALAMGGPMLLVAFMGSLVAQVTGARALATGIKPQVIDGILCVLVGLAGVWASRHAAMHFRKSDPGPVVIDEISGQLIAYLPLGALRFAGGGWKYVLLGFVLFRVLDIIKPPPARQAEKWRHGWGIMADDWFAGLYAALILWLVKWAGWLG